MMLPASACHSTVLKELRDFPATEQDIRAAGPVSAAGHL